MERTAAEAGGEDEGACEGTEATPANHKELELVEIPVLRQGGGVAGRRVEMYAAMLRAYIEAYLLAVRAVSGLDPEGVDRKGWVKRTLALGQRSYLAGELEHREALSKPKLEAALASLKDQKLVRFGPDETLLPGGKGSELVQLERRLASLLRD